MPILPDEPSPDQVPPRILRLWQAPWLWMAIVIVLFCAPLFMGLDHQDLENDEAIYSFSVKIMLKAGDWLTPKSIPSETSAFLEKPPLKFWIVGLPMKWGLLPATEYGMRFWDAVMGSVAFLYVFAIGRRLAGPVCGMAAVFLLFVHGPLVMYHGLRTNNMEAAVFLTYVAGMYHFLAWRTAAPDNRTHIFAIALYFVLGFMTKFVAALFLPLVLGMAILVKAEDRLRLRLNWLTFVLAAFLALALIAPWFVYEYFARGPRLIDIMFGAHVMKRFTAYLDPAHLHPWYFYFTELWRQLELNGSAWLSAIGAVCLAIQTVRRRWLEGLLMALWFIVPMAIISSGTSKLYHYAFPFLPPVALCGGYVVALVTRWIWRWLAAPVRAFVRARDRRLPAWTQTAAARTLTAAIATAGLMIGSATLLLGRLRVAIAGVVLLRNSRAGRVLIGASAAILLAAPAFLIRALLPFGTMLAILPVPAYRATLDGLEAINRPLHEINACMSDVIARGTQQGQPPPGVWIEAPSFSHTYNYYLHDWGPAVVRDAASNPTVAMHLFAPGEYGPVLLSENRFSGFVKELSTNSATLLGKVAAMTGSDLETIQAAARQAQIHSFTHEGLVLLLPGPYAPCAPERDPLSSR